MGKMIGYRPSFSGKIVITGAESSGKTTLASHLSRKLGIPLVAEYARDYLKDKLDYDYNDLLVIAREQKRREDELRGKHDTILCDTDVVNHAVWSRIKYGKVDDWMTHNQGAIKDNIYLLCINDLGWVEDQLRESSSLVHRELILQEHRDIILDHGGRMFYVYGKGELRFLRAERIVSNVVAW